MAAGWEEVAFFVESTEIPATEIPAAIRGALASRWLTLTIASDERLRGFRGHDEERRLEHFRRLDAEQLELANEHGNVEAIALF